MPTLRFIGDVHGEHALYRSLLGEADATIQVGDMGLDYEPLAGVDPAKHRFFPGNHDHHGDGPGNWSHCPLSVAGQAHYPFEGRDDRVFCVPGAWSIDQGPRIREAERGGPVTWWPYEELGYAEMRRYEAGYHMTRPDLVASHEAPLSVARLLPLDPRFPTHFGYPPGLVETRTGRFLDRLLRAHRPRLWVFGHYHCRWELEIDGTRFVALDMLRPNRRDQSAAILDVEV